MTIPPRVSDCRCSPAVPKAKKGKKSDGQFCKSGSPLEDEVTEIPLIICECIAHHRNLRTRGPRSMLGEVLPARNDAWLNAGPRALVAFTADNADIKFPIQGADAAGDA